MFSKLQHYLYALFGSALLGYVLSIQIADLFRVQGSDLLEFKFGFTLITGVLVVVFVAPITWKSLEEFQDTYVFRTIGSLIWWVLPHAAATYFAVPIVINYVYMGFGITSIAASAVALVYYLRHSEQ